MNKEERQKFEKRLFRVESILWVLLAINGLKGGAELIPVISALLSGG